MCDRGTNKHGSKSTGRRQVSPWKEKCPWIGRAIALKSNIDRWTYQKINPVHNHTPSLDSSVHPMHRRMSEEEQDTLKRQTQAGSRLHVIASDLRETHPELKKKDLLNARAKLQRQAAGPYTQTQRFIQALQESGEFHRICRDVDGHIVGGYSGPFHGARRWLNSIRILFLWIVPIT